MMLYKITVEIFRESSPLSSVTRVIEAAHGNSVSNFEKELLRELHLDAETHEVRF